MKVSNDRRPSFSALLAAVLCLPFWQSSTSLLTAASLSAGHIVVGAGAESIDCALEVDGTCQQKNPIKNEAAAEEATNPSVGAALECGVYMAPSTLGEATNMGMYAGRAFQKDDVIQSEIAIPLMFREWGSHKPGYMDGELWDRYIWEGSVADLDPVTDLNREDARAVFVPGIGCTINGIMDMNNLESTHGSIYDTVGLHRSKDAGAGAFCPYHFSNTTAVTDIPPGGELFATYGEAWIPSIPGAQITLEAQLVAAEEFLRDDYWPWIQARADKLSDDFKEKLWKITSKEFPLYSQTFTVLPQSSWAKVEEALKVEPPETSVVKKFIRTQSVRTLDWLNTHGYCQDHIRPAKSTIPQAGYGAFASRTLPQGTIVGYSPLIHMGEHGRDIYWIQYPEEADPIERKAKRRYDLILNYSFGHKNSTVLLAPYGGMVNYINHDKKRANVKVRWPHKELVAHKPWFLDKTPSQLRDTTEKIGLSFEYVALRDIPEGEEIFMDYGDEWEAAWNEHVQKWYPVPESIGYVHRSNWPEDYIRTVEEEPYPDNLVTICMESFVPMDDGSNDWFKPLVETSYRVYCRALKRTKKSESEDEENEESESESSYVYQVELDLNVDGKETKVVVDGVPDTGIFLVDRAYSQDWHLPNVFRHEIMIPDDVMPPAWLNGPPPPPREDDDGVIETQYPVTPGGGDDSVDDADSDDDDSDDSED
jgi:SET domain